MLSEEWSTSAPQLWAENILGKKKAGHTPSASPAKYWLCNLDVVVPAKTAQWCWLCYHLPLLLLLKEKLSSLVGKINKKESSRESVQFSPPWSHGSWKRSSTAQQVGCAGGREQNPGYFLSALPECSISQCIPSAAKQETFQTAGFAIRNCSDFFESKFFYENMVALIYIFNGGKKLHWIILDLPLKKNAVCTCHIFWP